MKTFTIEVWQDSPLYFETYFNAVVNTDALDEGIFTIYTLPEETEYIFSTDKSYYKITGESGYEYEFENGKWVNQEK